MARSRIVVIGAGMGGLATALDLAAAGQEVVVLERAATPGGKMRETVVAGRPIDAGPTVLTMPWVIDEAFAAAGSSLAAELTLRRAEILARHAWSADERLDLHADAERSADAIAAFAGQAEARRFRDFRERARRVHRALERPFIRAPRPGPLTLVGGLGGRGLPDLWRGAPFATLWHALGDHFHDPRLRQLFGRYATYCGSSPFEAPAILMLVADVEQEGVWLVEGGMHRVAASFAALAARQGACLRYHAEVAAITTRGSRVDGVVLASGERVAADAVVVNADVAAVAGGMFGPAVRDATPAVPRTARSLSAVTWAMAAETDGFPLLRHNVFFSDDYRAEFTDIFGRARLPGAPTVYVCAQDRDAADGAAPAGAERLLCLVNAPASGDTDPFDSGEIERCATRTFALLERCGLTVRRRPEATATTTPADFHRLFPQTGGALYGQASHGWRASFARPASRSRMPGLYLAGGSTHPGPGVPMAILSGRLAAAAVLADRASTATRRPAATRGGTSTR